MDKNIKQLCTFTLYNIAKIGLLGIVVLVLLYTLPYDTTGRKVKVLSTWDIHEQTEDIYVLNKSNAQLGCASQPITKSTENKLDDIFDGNLFNKADSNYDGLNTLIFTKYRSGSTFLGEFFNQNPDIAYMFEPFKLMTIVENTANDAKHAAHIKKHFLPTLKELFDCYFGNLNNYVIDNFLNEKWYKIVWKWHNTVFRPLYEQLGEYATTSGIILTNAISDVCKKYTHKAVKIIRGRLIKKVWKRLDPKSVKNRIIYLVRDPRGNIASGTRIQQLWTNSTKKDYINQHHDEIIQYAKDLCKTQARNIRFLNGIAENSPALKSFFMVRSEDIAYKPLYFLHKIYHNLQITLPDNVVEWVTKATSKDIPNVLYHPYTTQRNSRGTAEAWRKYLPLNIAQEIDKVCMNALNLLGYSPVQDEAHYNDTTFSYVQQLQRPYVLT